MIVEFSTMAFELKNIIAPPVSFALLFTKSQFPMLILLALTFKAPAFSAILSLKREFVIFKLTGSDSYI